MKTFNLITFGLLLITSSALSQSAKEPCGFDQLINKGQISQSELIIRNGINSRSGHAVKVIPVVVHVFHQNGTENISLAQIESQITVLNEDFRKILGTNGFGNGVDTKIKFSLAKIDQNGNCTNGVVRINSSLTNHKTYERTLLTKVSFWDNTKYLNIYVVKSIPGGTLGYASFPGGPADEDGLVIQHNYFGKIGSASSSLGRVGTHEVGHWLGIYHTFQNSCGTDTCTDGDFVCDTPPVSTANFGCTISNSCSNDSPDLPDQIQNYMDYTSELCKNKFTAGQAARMHSTLTTLRPLIWTQANLVATGCDSLYSSPATCNVVANFTSLNPEICINNTVNFTDISLNGAISWKWYFTGGTPSTSISQNPQVIYNALGNYDVKLVVTDSTNSDSIILVNFVKVTTPAIGQALPYQEDFESGVFPPNGITINNPDSGIGWELDSNASVSPSHSLSLDNLNSTNYGTIDEVILPSLDLSSISSVPYLKFKWAYAKSDALYSDELIVQVSVDCGATWNQTFYRSGTNLVTGPTQTTPFIPDSSQWKSASIRLFAYQNETNVSIKIMNVTDGGNFLYIDDINIGDVSVSLTENETNLTFSVFPNPNTGSFTITKPNFSDFTQNFRIYSTTGLLIRSVQLAKGESKIEINNLPPGAYIIVSDTPKGNSYKKLIVQ